MTDQQRMILVAQDEAAAQLKQWGWLPEGFSLHLTDTTDMEGNKTIMVYRQDNLFLYVIDAPRVGDVSVVFNPELRQGSGLSSHRPRSRLVRFIEAWNQH